MISIKSTVLTGRNVFTQNYSKPFGEGRDGFSRTECVITFVLTSAEYCEANRLPILGKIRSVVGHLYRPPEGTIIDHTPQSLAIQEALDIAKIQSNEISYLELHGPATQEGDIEEFQAIRSVFSSRGVMSTRNARPLFTGTMTATIGNTEVASGLVGILKTLMVLTNGLVAGCMGNDNTYNFDPSCDISSLNGISMPRSTTVTAFSEGSLFGSIHGFGINGYAGHAIVEVDDDVRKSWRKFIELRCSDEGYVVSPPISHLQNLTPEQLASVSSFSIHFPNGNRVEWIDPVDLRSVGDLSLVVVSDEKAVDVFPSGLAKPAPGKGLNKPAIVTLQNIECPASKTVEEYIALMKKALQKQNAELISYSHEEKKCTFRVEFF